MLNVVTYWVSIGYALTMKLKVTGQSVVSLQVANAVKYLESLLFKFSFIIVFLCCILRLIPSAAANYFPKNLSNAVDCKETAPLFDVLVRLIILSNSLFLIINSTIFLFDWLVVWLEVCCTCHLLLKCQF